MHKKVSKMVLFAPILVFLFFFCFFAWPQMVSAATMDIKYSPLFEASLQNTIREFDEKENGEYVKRLNGAVTEKVSGADYGDTETKPVVQLAYNIPGVPSVPSYTSSYSCGATCGSTCGATCGSTCGSTCSSTCTSTCTYTCGSTCGSTCAGSSTCVGSSTCMGSSTCQGSSTCVGNNTCAGSNTCFTATCYGYSTCSGASTCNGTSTCTYGSGVCTTLPPGDSSSGGGSSGGGSSGNPSPSNPIPETPTPNPTSPNLPAKPADPGYSNGGKPSGWATDEVYEAINYNFVPVSLRSNYQSNITRKEFCSLMMQFLKEVLNIVPEFDGIMDIDLGESPFTDVNDNDVTWAYYLGIVNGVGGGRFNPDGYITRQEAAVMLVNLAEVFGMDTWADAASFSDGSQIAGWAGDSVDFVCKCGIMYGIGGNNFGPQNPYTREQSIVTILRLWYTVIPEE